MKCKRGHWLGVGLGFVLAAVGIAGDVDGDGWRDRAIEINGRTVQEIRFGGRPDGSELVMLVLTNGPAGGTSMVAKTLALETLFFDDPVDWDELGNGQYFSLGGGCHLGGADVFVYIDQLKPKVLRVLDGMYTIVDPVGPTSHQYAGADCAVSSDGSRVHYVFMNRTMGRLEFFSESTPGVVVNQNFNVPSVGDPFSGFARFALGTARGNDVSLFFQRSDGLMRDALVDPVARLLRQTCDLFWQIPPPTVFTFPREFVQLPVPLTGASTPYRFGAVGDFNGDGQTEVAWVNSSGACGLQSTSFGPAGGGPPYGWSGFVAIGDPIPQRVMVGNGSTFGVIDTRTGVVTPFPNQPTLRPGGPVAGIAVTDNELNRPCGLIGSATLIELPSGVMMEYSCDPLKPEDYIFGGSLEFSGPARIGKPPR